jgi:hypothetical protein
MVELLRVVRGGSRRCVGLISGVWLVGARVLRLV